MKVYRKQRNSRMCAVCGMDNPKGLRAQFYTMEDGSVVTLFAYSPDMQSYPGRVHGGWIASMVDELGLRGMWAGEGEERTYGVTLDLSMKYRKPVPYGETLIARGKLTSETSHFFGVHSGIYLRDGTCLAEGDVKYMKFDPETISEGAKVHEEMCYLLEDGVGELDLPPLK